MNLHSIVLISLGFFPLLTDTIRCYKCDATNECKIIKQSSLSRSFRYSSDNLEIIDCEHYCWKAVSLGNVYRGCAKKRCTVSHSFGILSSSLCCQTDYCNEAYRLVSSKFFLIILIVFNFTHKFFLEYK